MTNAANHPERAQPDHLQGTSSPTAAAFDAALIVDHAEGAGLLFNHTLAAAAAAARTDLANLSIALGLSSKSHLAELDEATTARLHVVFRCPPGEAAALLEACLAEAKIKQAYRQLSEVSALPDALAEGDGPWGCLYLLWAVDPQEPGL